MYLKNRKNSVRLSAEPLFFNQVFCETIWGGQQLRTNFNKSVPDNRQIGESWEISGFGNSQTVISNGSLQGQTLGAIFAKYPKELIGESAQNLPFFPLLVKFIDAHDALSVQVHPDDRNAQTLFGEQFGKTECWYIAKAGVHATLGIGFTKNILHDELRKAITTGTLEELLHIFPVNVGEVYFIPAGTVHTIMGDVVIYEVQQSSNTTLRMYDWQRIDASGKPRPLHIEDAVAVADLSGNKNYRIEPLEIHDAVKSTRRIRIACPYFAIEEYRCEKDILLPLERHHSCRILSIVEGTADLVWKNGKNILYKGSTVLIPAILDDVSIVGRDACTCLSTFIPDMQREIIEPLIRYGFTTRQISGLGDVFN
jgi:mannose-6-phosphate isomerase